jgi:hypothetical protein
VRGAELTVPLKTALMQLFLNARVVRQLRERKAPQQTINDVVDDLLTVIDDVKKATEDGP